jgi:hypothetical protein
MFSKLVEKVRDFFKGVFRGKKKKDPPAALKEIKAWLET